MALRCSSSLFTLAVVPAKKTCWFIPFGWKGGFLIMGRFASFRSPTNNLSGCIFSGGKFATAPGSSATTRILLVLLRRNSFRGKALGREECNQPRPAVNPQRGMYSCRARCKIG